LSCARSSDTVARIGGDEFAILQIGIDGAADAQRLCERVLKAMAPSVLLDGHELRIGTSMGVALLPDDGEDAARILQNADIALYRAKRLGRGRFCFFEPGMDEQLRQRRALEAELREGLAAGQFETYYQPLLAVRTERVVGLEALVRWRHPERGLVPPLEFVAVAEETGLILAIGEQVLRQACRDARRWPGLQVSVNLSPLQFRQHELPQLLRSALDEAGLWPEALALEVAESVLLDNVAEAMPKLQALKAIGVQVVMDAFGAHDSSLGCLKRFPFDKIKIDRSFLAGGACQPGTAAMIKAILGLSHSLGVPTCAGGVETSTQLDLLRAQGCEEAQGFLFSEAVPAAAIDALVASLGCPQPSAMAPALE
jgi:predicted signal transduction protein with EAL and GGDEF domain